MSDVIFTTIIDRIAAELGVEPRQVAAAVALLDDGATVPFIARYRKEATGSLDDSQLRTLEARLLYLRELEERRTAILASVLEQGKLTPELEEALRSADTKTRLEDLYAPLRPKKRTRAQQAREQGLEPLAESLLADPTKDPRAEAASYVNEATGVADVTAALDGARAILVERFSEDPELVGGLREYMWEHGVLRSVVVEGQQEKGQKFRDYFDGREPVKQAPSHRVLALLRGRNEGVLSLSIELPDDEQGVTGPGEPERRVAAFAGVEHCGRAADDWLQQAVRVAWRARLRPKLENDTEQRLRELAEEEAIRVFGTNLRDLLLAAPAGARVTMGLDPGIRTGVKVAVVDRTGAVAATATIFPHEPRKDWDGALATLAELCRVHRVDLVAIGNGTASRETERLVADLMARHPELGLTRVVVSEAGASVYSASELAAKELPDLDVTLRGAVSIARRLQDPLAELVKIEPKAIGVGQYQHDVSQVALARTLDGVVEDCVNAVGADVNTASPALLSRISGLTPRIASQIVAYRSEHGPFTSRAQLREVPRFGEKTFEQAAGFLRVRGDNVLDASAVHPEAYPVVERIAQATGRDIPSLIGDGRFLRTLQPEAFADDRFGAPTVRDILRELEKPGRDPRPEFRTARFSDGVHTLEDLRPGMTLEGVVTNVANFGAFVDIGVHHDGLVHVSQLADRFVKDPRDVVKAGDIVTVTVLEVDLPRQRVALTMRKGERPAKPAGRPARAGARPNGAAKPPSSGARPRPSAPPPSTAMSAAFERLRRDR
jgi:uncharacterized protein